MATQLTIEAPGRTPGKLESGSAPRRRQPLPCDAVAVPPVGRADPTVAGAAPGRRASRAYRRSWRSRYAWVEGIVTMGTLIGLTVAPVLMAGEWLGGQVATLTQTIATAVTGVLRRAPGGDWQTTARERYLSGAVDLPDLERRQRAWDRGESNSYSMSGWS